MSRPAQPPPPDPADRASIVRESADSGGRAPGGDDPGGRPPGGGEDGPGPGRGLLGAGLFVLVVAGVVAAAAVMVDGSAGTGADGATGEPTPTAPAEGPMAGGALGSVLQEIDAAERAMISYQRDVGRALAPSPDGTADEAVAEAARQGIERLREVREQLTGELPDDGAVDAARATRDAYVPHLDAWVSHMQRVVDEPSRAGPEAPDDEFDDINTTAREFASTLRSELPEDAPAEVQQLARLILERGFETGGTETPGQLV